MVTEASYLNTGYAKYSRELLQRLHASGKYEIAELACYGTLNPNNPHFNPAVSQVPWKIYPNLPETQDEANQYNSNPINQFGEWRFEQVCLDFKPHIVFDVRDYWMCLTPNTNIVCYNSIKKVQDIKVGDIVLTHKGRYKKVINKFERKYFGNLHTIVASHCPFDVELTDGHPVYCLKRNDTPGLPELNKSQLQWVDAENVKKGDMVVYPIEEEGVHDWDVDFCRLLGYFMAKGCLMYEGRKENDKLKGIQFTLNASETKYIEDVKRCIYKKYKLDTKVKIVGNAAILRCYDKTLAVHMKNNCGELSGHKRMSTELFYTNNECIRAFLCGLFRGDGGYYENRATYCTKSEQLAHQVFRLCLRLGILPSFNKNKNTLNGDTFHRYIFSFRKKALSGFVTIYDNQLDLPITPSKRIKDGYAWLTVKEVVVQQYGTTVHNFEVEEDNTYVSSFCIHNCDFEERSPFRRLYKWVIMPTVDASPQNPQWLDTYSNADAVFTYSQWGASILRKEGGGRIHVLGSAPPSASDYFQKLEKDGAKSALTIDPSIKLVGTVMRNQKRKLYGDLFQGFRKFLDKANRNDILLYCHVTYPDVGWKIPNLLTEYGVTDKVITTYFCRYCKSVFASLFNDAVAPCIKCGHAGATLPSIEHNITDQALALIYNSFDVYVQYANSEGFGVPQVEAAACGVPVMAIDYSAMTSVVRNLNGTPLTPKALYREVETGCMRAVPDNDLLADELEKFFSKPGAMRKIAGEKSRRGFEEHYQWDATATKWMDCFDNLDIVDLWDSSPRIYSPQQQIPQGLSHREFARFLIQYVLGQPEKLDSYLEARLTRDLNYGLTLAGGPGQYENDDTMANRPQWKPFNRKKAFEYIMNLCNKNNYWEQRRVES